MLPQEVNDGIARAMGLKSQRVGFTRVRENFTTKEVIVTIEVYANKKQIAKIKNLLVEHLQYKT